MIFENHFVRFPNLRIASVENGAEFLPDLFRKLRSTANKIPGYFPEDPIEHRSAATCGSTRSGRTTSTRSST